MKFQQYDLGHQKRGNIVEVTLSGSAANVRLLDSSNLNKYKSNRNHKYYGGCITKSPARLTIPRTDTWYVTVDLQGIRGRVSSSVRVISRESLSPLPEYSSPSISGLVQPVRGHALGDNEHIEVTTSYYDVFISHATEDKDTIVRPLASSLISKGLRVWYDEFELRIGDSLRRKIDNGLTRSRFGVVVISPSFLSKNWPQYELDGLVTREMTGDQVILPLWHKVDKQEVIDYSPSLADKVARNTSDATIEEIAFEIAEVIKETS